MWNTEENQMHWRGIKAGICFLVILSFTGSLFAQDMQAYQSQKINKNSPDYLRGKNDGKADAEQYYNPHRWRNGGLVGGLLLGLPGTIIVVGISQAEISPLKAEEADFLKTYSPDYKSGYFKGYLNKAQEKRVGPVMVGGLIGSVFSAAIVYSIIKAKEKPQRH
jgi:hypothetical protein